MAKTGSASNRQRAAVMSDRVWDLQEHLQANGLAGPTPGLEPGNKAALKRTRQPDNSEPHLQAKAAVTRITAVNEQGHRLDR